jgi:cytosine/adenosine deaminase-related metal-dependent hydrolase
MKRMGSAEIGRLGLAVALLAGVTPARAAPVPHGLVLDHVTIVDVRTGQLDRNRAVVVADGRIVRISPGGVAVAAGMRRIDGHGRFVIPGFNDMHAHNLNTDSSETSLPLMLANGITGFRQMAGTPQLLAARARGRLLLPANSPALLAMPGTILAGPAFADPAAVTAEVNRQKTQGADFIKVIDTPPAAFRAAAVAAAANGLHFAGHLLPTMDAREAMRLGMISIEHLGPGISLLISCSRDEAAIRTILAAAPVRIGGTNFGADPALVQRMLANPMLATPAPGYALIRRVLDTYDEAKCRAFAQDIAASKTWMVPTLTRLEAMELGDIPALRDNPNLRYVPVRSRELWRAVGAEFGKRLTDDQRQVLADLFARQLRFTGLLQASGAKMMAGTDFGGGWIVPGFSLHHEFDLLARAGLPPLRVLQMTTVDPAVFLGRAATMGTVEPGRDANLVLLDADPTASVANLHRIAAVVRAGRYLDRAALDAIEASAAAELRKPDHRPASAGQGGNDDE